jgi:hypothetical protein
MGYSEALEAAGAEIIVFREFGSYQGDWWAMVRYNGERGWVNGSYGSCSGCDAFEAEFGYVDQECSEHQRIHPKPEQCAACDEAAADYKRRLASFGRNYLDPLLTQEDAEKKAGSEVEWDSNAPEMLDFIKQEGGLHATR